MSQPGLLEVAVIVSVALDKLAIPHLIGGSVASTLHGEPRLTNDVDFAAAIGQQHVVPFARALQGPFYADEVLMRDAIRRRGMFNVIHMDSANKIDVHVLEPDDFQKSQLARAVRVKLAPSHEKLVPLASAEDIVLQKLLWNRKSGEASHHQLRDVIGVLKSQRGKLDLKYMSLWAGKLGLDEMLNRALGDSGVQGP